MKRATNERAPDPDDETESLRQEFQERLESRVPLDDALVEFAPRFGITRDLARRISEVRWLLRRVLLPAPRELRSGPHWRAKRVGGRLRIVPMSGPIRRIPAAIFARAEGTGSRPSPSRRAPRARQPMRSRARGEALRPTVGSVSGVEVMIFAHADAPPHVHLSKGDVHLVVDIIGPSVPSGFFTAAETRALAKWIAKNEVPLLENWALARAGRPLFRIP